MELTINNFWSFITYSFYPIIILLILLSGLKSIIGLICMLAIIYYLKVITNKERPNKKDKLSFPSGHTATVWYIAGIYNWNPIILLWAISVSYSRIVLSYHDLIDVFAGFIIGTLSSNIISGKIF